MTLVLTFLVLAIAFTGQAAVGFGGGLVAIPLLCLLYPVKEAVTLYLFFQIMEIGLIFRSRSQIDWTAAKRVIPVALVFVLIGTFSLTYFSETILRGTLSLIIVSYLVKEVFFSHLSLKNKDSTLFAFFAGGLGGWLQGLFGAGGPGFLIYFNEIGLDKYRFRVTMLLLSFLCNLVRVLTSLYTGLFSEKIVTLAIYCLPVVCLALYAGYQLHHRISETVFKRLTYTVLLISSLSLSYGVVENWIRG